MKYTIIILAIAAAFLTGCGDTVQSIETEYGNYMEQCLTSIAEIPNCIKEEVTAICGTACNGTGVYECSVEEFKPEDEYVSGTKAIHAVCFRPDGGWSTNEAVIKACIKDKAAYCSNMFAASK